MKIKKSELKQIIKEELESILTERLSQREFRQEVFNLAKAFDNPEYVKKVLNPLKDLYSKLDIGNEKMKRRYAEDVIRAAFSQYSDTEQQDLLSQFQHHHQRNLIQLMWWRQQCKMAHQDILQWS